MVMAKTLFDASCIGVKHCCANADRGAVVQTGICIASGLRHTTLYACIVFSSHGPGHADACFLIAGHGIRQKPGA